MTIYRSFILFALALIVSGSANAAREMQMIEFFNDSEPASEMQIDHSRWQAILDRYVDDQHPSGIHRFNYEKFTVADRDSLQQYLDYLQLMEPRQLNPEEAKAYWINLFNAATLRVILDSYRNEPVESIKDLRGGLFGRRSPWSRKNLQVVQQKLSLRDIQDGILRPIYKDHRIHFALFLGALGGPNMSKQAFTGDNNEVLLTQLETDYLNHPRSARVENSELVLSNLFEWFDTDFAQDQAGLVAYLRDNTNQERSESLNLFTNLRYEYDWTLNKP